MDIFKKFIPCIYLKQGMAIAGLKDDSVISADPVALVKEYSSGNADEILLFDLSLSDAEHEQAITCIRSICANVKIPVIGCGNIRRMEDVKKLIYAGCSMVALNYSKQSNIDLTREVSLKFGRNRIAACCIATDAISENRDLIENYVQEMILLDENSIKNAMQISGLPFIIHIPDVSLDKIMELLKSDSIWGITGNAINSNIKQLTDVKMICQENGIAVNLHTPVFKWNELKLNSDGMIPVIVQEDSTDQVLMLAYMNEEAYNRTMETGKMTYWSRSRNELWIKGDTSGHYQYVRSITADCDLDTLLARVDQIGAACHTGNHSCFFNKDLVIAESKPNTQKIMDNVLSVINDRKIHPKEGSYTNYLLDKGIDKILKKIGEEASEVIIAAKNSDNSEIVYELSDLLYHMMVLMAEKEIDWQDISEEMVRREQK